LDALATALLANETLDEAEAYRVAGVIRLTKDEEAQGTQGTQGTQDTDGQGTATDH
jgi:cell division protease FtsH